MASLRTCVPYSKAPAQCCLPGLDSSPAEELMKTNRIQSYKMYWASFGGKNLGSQQQDKYPKAMSGGFTET